MNKHTLTTYNSFGFTERIYAAGVQDLNMEFETATGNLNWRKDLSGSRNLEEVFNFDNQNRLLNGQVTSPVNLQQYFLNYNSNGTIAEKSDAGVYSEYDPLHPDAVKIIESQAGNISHLPQQLEFNPFNKLSWITEGNYILNINYGPDQQRRKTELSTIVNGSVQTTKYFLSNYEKIIDNGTVYEINYITAPSGLCAMYVTTNGVGKMYYVYSDHLGSILKVTDHNGTTYEQNFDAWGRYRNPATWNYTGIPSNNPVWMHRGFTSHEHLDEFVLINMNGRLYDPVVGAMLSPDNYVADATSAIAFNRYAYCFNNPFKYTDPSGDFIFTALAVVTGQWWALPMAIGADIGMWQGGSLANGTMNPFKWDYNSGRTWSYMAAGTTVGAASGGVASAVATSGMVGANTSAIMAASFVNSAGTAMYTGGQTDVSVSFGFASYNFDKNEWGYLGGNGNSTMTNIGYGLGALANVSDVLAGFKPGSVELQTENMSGASGKDLTGHTQLNHNGDVLVDFGPTGDWTKFEPGRNDWVSYASDGKYKLISEIPGNQYSPINVHGVNVDRLYQISARMNSKPGFYQVLTRSCSSAASRALTMSGVPAIGIHPYILHAQMYLRSIGVRPTLYSYYLYNR